MRCPLHGQRLVVEDVDRDYGHVIYVCPARDCLTQRHEGPSEDEIRRREHPGPRPGARPRALPDVWRTPR